MKKIIIAAAAILGAFVCACGAFLYKKYLRTDTNKFGSGPDPDDMEWLKTIDYKDTYMMSRDGYCLHGAVIDNNSDNWIVLVHGYDSEWRGMLGYARKFISEGYSVFLPDMRGFGMSGDIETTMGHLEKYDLTDWINRLADETGAKNILLFGVSMGAAIVMLTSAEKLPETVRGVVEDCGYSSVRKEFEYNLPHTTHLPPYPILWVSDIITRIMKGWSFLKDADVVSAVRRTRLPICFIHGSADTFVPFYMQKELYDACPRPDKGILVIDGAEHTEACGKNPELYWKTVFGFIDRHFVK